MFVYGSRMDPKYVLIQTFKSFFLKGLKMLESTATSTSHERTTFTILTTLSLHRTRNNLIWTVKYVSSFERNILYFQSINFQGVSSKSPGESSKSHPTSNVGSHPDGQIRPAVVSTPKKKAWHILLDIGLMPHPAVSVHPRARTSVHTPSSRRCRWTNQKKTSHHHVGVRQADLASKHFETEDDPKHQTSLFESKLPISAQNLSRLFSMSARFRQGHNRTTYQERSTQTDYFLFSVYCITTTMWLCCHWTIDYVNKRLYDHPKRTSIGMPFNNGCPRGKNFTQRVGSTG